MTAVQSWRCDALTIPAPTTTPSGLYMSSGTVRDRIECCAISRAAATATTLHVITGRDGWRQLPDGTHLCPIHAAATP